jgi:VanZ family protein
MEVTRQLRYRKPWLAIGWGMVVTVVYFCLIPHPPQLVSFAYGDKFEHVIAYTGLSLWFFQIGREPGAWLRTGLWLFGLGVGIEIAQAFTVYRSFEFADMAADAVGILLGAALARTPLGSVLRAVEDLLVAK